MQWPVHERGHLELRSSPLCVCHHLVSIRAAQLALHDLHAQVTVTRVSTMAKVTVHTCVILLNVQCSVTPEQMFVISIHMHVPYTASVAECTQLRLDMSSPCGVQGYGHVIWTGDSVPAGTVATCRDLGFSRSLAFFTGTASL